MTTKTAAITTWALTVIAMAALTVAPAHAASVCDDKVHLLTTGTSTAFETNGRWVLVGGDRAAYDYLTSRGVKKLDAYVAPSANPDVISAAPDIIGAFKPDAVWTPAYDELRAGGRTAGADDAYRRLSDAALAANRSYGAKTVTGADSGTQFTVGDIQFTLYRSTDATPDTVGGGGYVVKAESHGGSVLLTGDMQASDGIGVADSDSGLSAQAGQVTWVTAPNRGRAAGGPTGVAEETGAQLLFQQESESEMPVWLSWGGVTARYDMLTANDMRHAGYGELEGVFSGGSISRAAYGGVSGFVTYAGETPGGGPAAWHVSDGRPSPSGAGWVKGGGGFWYWFGGQAHADTNSLVGELPDMYWVGGDGRMATSAQWVVYRAGRYRVQDGGKVLGGGWNRVDGSWYYMNAGGLAVTGWLQSGDSWYYMDPDTSAMRTGWVSDGSGWFYLGESGVMRTGWLNDGGAWYYLSPSGGRMVTGWQQVGGSWYYMNEHGVMVTGSALVDDVTHLFDGSGRWLGRA